MSRRPRDRAAFEAHIGHVFADPTLLDRALTHISALDAAAARTESYQRLEFLGDQVLGLAVCELLFRTFPTADEGELSRRRNDLVRRETCAEVAADMGLAPLIRLGVGEAHSGGRRKQAILADACEAVIGATFIDGGFAAAAALVERFWSSRLAKPSDRLMDAKTALQEWSQGRGLPPPSYAEIARSGPDHRPEFVVRVDLPGLRPAEGRGPSKRAAEQAAAAALLVREHVWPETADA